jgi:SOS response regulatory protein OraA/RecX
MSNQKAKQYALSLLAKREYPRYKLACKLQEKGFSFQCTETVLDELYQLGWQSDWRYVAQKIRHQLNCYRGPERIYAYLKREQIDPEIIDRILV